jgi:uncharacterized membrane protein YhaH (DUF805 family)
MHWYTDVIRKYAVFSGRAARPEFWWFVLINLIIAALINVVVSAIGGRNSGQVVSDIYSLAVFLPSLGVGIRRLHDTNRSGWWYLLVFIPIVGWIVLIVFLAMAGDPGPNRYGPNPQNPDAGAGDMQFDPQTGERLSPTPTPRFDPQTGQPLAPPPSDPPA